MSSFSLAKQFLLQAAYGAGLAVSAGNLYTHGFSGEPTRSAVENPYVWLAGGATTGIAVVGLLSRLDRRRKKNEPSLTNE